jgi:hypothetical protein
MVIAGLWLPCDDGITRPIVVVRARAVNGSTLDDRFLIDSGADRTVQSADFLGRLGLVVKSEAKLAGIGGEQGCVLVNAALEMTRTDGGIAVVRGDYAAFADPTATDLSILGRDVVSNFDLILSRRRNEVLLLAPPHSYRVESN